jgi:hypothetical protein
VAVLCRCQVMSAPVPEAMMLPMLIRSGLAGSSGHSRVEAREERVGWFWD